MNDGAYSINGGLSPLLSPMKHAHSQGSDVHRFSFEMPQQHGLQVRHEAMRPGNGANPVHEQAVFPQDAAQKPRPAVSVQVSQSGEGRVMLAVRTRLADWTMEKSPRDFLDLQALIEQQMPFVDLRCRLRSADPADASVQSLQLFLNELLANKVTSSTTAVISFLDDRKTLQTQLQVLRLTNDVVDLRTMVATLQSSLQIQQAKMNEQAQTIRELTRRLTMLEQVDSASDVSPTRDSLQSRSRPQIDTSDSSMPGFTLGLGPQFLGASVGTQRPLSQTMLMMRPSDSSADENSDQEDSNHFPGLLAEVMQVNTPPSPATGHFWDRKDHGDHSWGRGSFTFHTDTASDNPLPLNLIPSSNDLGPLESKVDEIIGLIMPTEEHNLHREYIARFISRQVRKTLGGQTYGIGVHALRCYLPDDPITLSVFLCRGQESSWYIRLNEALCRVSGGVSTATSTTGTPTADEGDEGVITKFLTNVNFVNSGGEHRLQCVVDQLAVDIVPNCMRDLAWAGLFEELDRLVGKHHLLKRSCALLRAWWVYETTGYSGKSMLRYVTADALLVMMVCVFNLHHARIQQPLQALALFFHVFSVFPWQTHAVTIFGPVPLDPTARANEASGSPTSASTPLITQDVVSPFLQTLYPPTPTPTEPLSGDVSPRMSMNLAPFADVAAAINDDIDSPVERQSIHGGEPPTDGRHPYAPSNASSTSTKPIIAAHCAIEEGFPRRAMNVVHPLVRDENLVTEVVSRSKAARIQEAILVGAKNLRSILEHSAQSNRTERDSSINRSTAHINTSVSLLENLFAHVLGRFGQGWRPDNLDRGEWRESFIGQERTTDYEVNRLSYDDIPSEMQADNDDPWEVNMAGLWEQLRYCSLLLESQVTISALRTLSREILADRGPLPVGEIGKLLQETTSIATLSTILKDQFGGLKKFLEKFPADFLISGDHPFNPHVYLRANLSDDDVTKILEGAPPAHITPKTRKRGNRRRKSGTGMTPVQPSSASQEMSPPAGSTMAVASAGPPGLTTGSYSSTPASGMLGPNKFMPVQHPAYSAGVVQQQYGPRMTAPPISLTPHPAGQGALQHPMQPLSPLPPQQQQQQHQHHLASRRPRPQIVTQGLMDPFGMGTNPHAREFVPRTKSSNM